MCVPTRAASQSAKPVVVVSVAGYDALMADLACLGEIGDHRDLEFRLQIDEGVLKVLAGARNLKRMRNRGERE